MVVGQATNNGIEADRSNNGSEFDLVVGQAMHQRRTRFRQRRTRFRQRRTGPTTEGRRTSSNNCRKRSTMACGD